MSGDDDGRRAAGRPRDEAVGPAILAAARRLVVALGYEAVTTRMIADAAGAGKQTLYRRWPSKAELVLDAFLTYAEAEVDRKGRAPATIRAEVARFLRDSFRALDATAPALRGLMATAQHDEAFRTLFRTRFIEPRRRSLLRLLRDGMSDGQLPTDADVETAVVTLYGALWYRLLLGEALDDAFAGRLADLVVAGLVSRE